MEGGKDPDNRRYMIWDSKKWNKDIFDLYKKLIQIRKDNSILTEGDFRFIYAKNMVIGYERFINDNKLVIFINNSNKSVHIDVTQLFGNGDFIDISKDHPLKRKKAYTLYENEFVILKKVKDR
jgi:glycosidase